MYCGCMVAYLRDCRAHELRDLKFHIFAYMDCHVNLPWECLGK